MGNVILKDQAIHRGSDKTERVLLSAAGAVTYADGVELLLDMPDAQLGKKLKSHIAAIQHALSAANPALTVSGAFAPELPEVSGLGGERIQSAAGKAAFEGFAAQARASRQTLVKQQKLLSSQQLWSSLSMTRQALSAATRSGRLFTVDVDGDTYYPAFFADGSIDRATLEKVSRELGSLPGWSKWDFFTSARGSLGGISALDALRKGRVDEVMRVAKAFVQEAAH